MVFHGRIASAIGRGSARLGEVLQRGGITGVLELTGAALVGGTPAAQQVYNAYVHSSAPSIPSLSGPIAGAAQGALELGRSAVTAATDLGRAALSHPAAPVVGALGAAGLATAGVVAVGRSSSSSARRSRRRKAKKRRKSAKRRKGKKRKRTRSHHSSHGHKHRGRKGASHPHGKHRHKRVSFMSGGRRVSFLSRG